MIIGAWLYDTGSVDEGAAFVYLGEAAGISSGSPLTADAILQSNQVGARLGVSVAGAGDVNGDGYADVIVGSHFYDAALVNEGAAFVFLGGAGGIANGNPTTAATTLESNQAGALLGISVAGAGDVNRDGYADVIVGAHGYDAPSNAEGAAFVFLGGAGGIANGSPATAHATLESNQIGAQLGISVAGAGDVNRDGYADVIVGAYGYDSGELNEGAAFVFLGSAAGIATGHPGTANATIQSNQEEALLGVSVAGVGDVNGDGYGDIIVGAHGFDADSTDEGAAFVFRGGASGIPSGNPTTAPTTLTSNQTGARLGISVAGAGDVNGDGYSDVIVGARLYDAGQTDEGGAFVFLGGPGGIPSADAASAASIVESQQASAFLGGSVAGAGDVNGDGFADVIVGATGFLPSPALQSSQALETNHAGSLAGNRGISGMAVDFGGLSYSWEVASSHQRVDSCLAEEGVGVAQECSRGVRAGTTRCSRGVSPTTPPVSTWRCRDGTRPAGDR